MRVYLLIHSGGYDDLDTILGAFSSHEAAQATLDAMNAVPWEVRMEESNNPHRADHASRRMDIEGFRWQFCESALRWVSDREKRPEWPGDSRTRIVEYELRDTAAAVKGVSEEEWIASMKPRASGKNPPAPGEGRKS